MNGTRSRLFRWIALTGAVAAAAVALGVPVSTLVLAGAVLACPMMMMMMTMHGGHGSHGHEGHGMGTEAGPASAPQGSDGRLSSRHHPAS